MFFSIFLNRNPTNQPTHLLSTNTLAANIFTRLFATSHARNPSICTFTSYKGQAGHLFPVWLPG